MSIAVLNDVYTEVRRLAVAGSHLAVGDFRLKKLVGPLEKSAKKAPVFGKVAEAITKLIESTPQTSAAALLDLASLTTAILYTQGATGKEGELKPLETNDLQLTVSQTSARLLKPLIAALTSTGSGRFEVIRDAHQRGAFKDLRLIKPAIQALEDPYAEIADFVAEHVLPIYGKAIYGEIKADFDPKGKGDDARRLKLMHRLDPVQTTELVDNALENGSKEVKVEALNCLAGRKDAADYLLDQVKARAKDVRSAAYRALAPLDLPDVIPVLKEALAGNEVELVADHVGRNPNKGLQKFVVTEAERQLKHLLSSAVPAAKKKQPTKKSLTKQVDNFAELLNALRGRTDKGAVTLLIGMCEQAAEIHKLQGTYVDGANINYKVGELLLSTGDKQALEKLIEAGRNQTTGAEGLSFLASCKLHSPKEVFEQFSPIYKHRPSGRKKADQEARERSEVLAQSLATITRREHDWEYHEADEQTRNMIDKIKLDPRWLDTAIAIDDFDTVVSLARPKHKGLHHYLSAKVKAELERKTWSPDYHFGLVMRMIVETGHPDLMELFLPPLERSLKATHQRWYVAYQFLPLIPQLPETAIAPLQAMIGNISNNETLDAFVGAVDELRQRHTKP